MNRRRFLLSLPASLFVPTALAASAAIPLDSPVPGGVARIGLGPAAVAPRARLGATRVLVMRDGGEWVALVGIALATKPGAKLTVEVERPERKVDRHEVTVASKTYAAQHLKVPPRQVELSAEDLARYERERAHLGAVLRTFTEEAPATLAMLQPTPGVRSASFGLRRFFNKQARNPHNGIGIAAPEGTP